MPTPSTPAPFPARFCCGGYEWCVPAATLRGDGFTLVLCREIPQAQYAAYHAQWAGREEDLTPQQCARAEAENPWCLDVGYTAHLPTGTVWCGDSRGMGYYPPSLGLGEPDPEAAALVRRYGLNPAALWELTEANFPWPRGGRPPQGLAGLRLSLTTHPAPVPLGLQITAAPGCAPFGVAFTNPLTGTRHTLRVLGCAAQSVPPGPDDAYDYPAHTLVLTWRLEPPLPAGQKLTLHDCAEGDRPRPKAAQKGSNAVLVAVITGTPATGPDGAAEQATVSALHFAPPAAATWYAQLQPPPAPPATAPLVGEG